ncbi:MAG: hypothetical protein RJA52_639 [Bacteroidota bacterium]
MKKLILIAFGFLFFSNQEILAQLRTPSSSPGATTNQTVGLTDVSISYNRPSKKNRVIFAVDGLVPFGKVWRTGANSVSKITFSEEVIFGGTTLKAGSYAILTIPDANEWQVMLFTYETANWASYPEKTPVANIKVTPSSTSSVYETFTMEINHISNDGAHFLIKWDQTKIAIPFEVHTKKQAMASFEKMVAGPSDSEYYNFGAYLFESNGDLDKALEYVQKVTNKSNPMYWQKRTESLILGKLGRKAEAIEAAKKSLELAKAAGNEDYIRMNEQSIKDWSK